MSNAAGQAVRAGIREGTGNGQSQWVNALTNPTAFLSRMTSSPEEISALLKSQKIASKDEKFNLFKQFFPQRVPLRNFLSTLGANNTNEFDRLDWGEKVKAKTGYTTEGLGVFIFDLRNALALSLPMSHHFHSLGNAQKGMIQSLHVMYEKAEHTHCQIFTRNSPLKF